MKSRSTSSQCFVLLFATLFFTPQLIASTDSCDDGADLFAIYCPDDITLSCSDELWDLSVYGNANYHDYTGWHDAGYPTEHWNLGSCNTGTITRTWTVEDYNWNLHTCTQTITVGTGSGSFGYNDITWPLSHLELEGCNPSTHPSQLPVEYGWPTYDWTECSNVGVSYSDYVFTVNDGCKKIIRKWTVRDWCQSYNTGWGYSSHGSWTYDQVIKIMGGEEPTVTCEEEIVANSYNCYNAVVNVDPLEVYGTSCGSDYTITNNSPYADEGGADISGTYPIGYTYVDYIVHYGCGKRKKCRTRVTVKDKKGPTVYCYGEITVALMGVDEDHDGIPEDGMVEIWAKDLDKGSTASCNGHSLKFSFSEDVTETNKVFTCADVGTNDVRMYVTDNQGRQTYCLVKVHVQNNGANIPDCEPEDDTPTGGDDDSTYVATRFSIGGMVMANDEKPFAGAEFTLTDMDIIVDYVVSVDTVLQMTTDSFINASGALLYFTIIDSVFTTTTDTIERYHEYHALSKEEGTFLFEEVADSNSVFTLEAKVLETEEYKGIDEQDLDFLLEFILGQVEFETIEQYIAADINGDKKIDFDDLKILLNHVSGEQSDILSYDWTIAKLEKGENLREIFKNYDPAVTMAVDAKDHVELQYTAIKIGDLVKSDSENSIRQIPLSDIAYAVQRSTSEQELAVQIRSIVEAIAEQSVSVSPNPFLDKLNINYTDQTAGIITIEVVDVKGQSVLRQYTTTIVGENNISLDMSAYKNTGILVYRIIDEDKLLSGKVLRL